MPVIVTFDVPVTDKAADREAHDGHQRAAAARLVALAQRQRGALAPEDATGRPAPTSTVDVDVNSVPAGNGIYGQETAHVDFHVGDAQSTRSTRRPTRCRSSATASCSGPSPITTGKPGLHHPLAASRSSSRSSASKRMNSETVGIDPNSADGYDIDDVEYAMRVTYSGEFLHAAPWSVGAQGYANVSHGCTGMSTANADWLYDMSKRGDVVEYTGTDRPMTLTNGYGDWNESFAAWTAGSAL